MMIPRLVHYIWVGQNPMPAKNQRLLEGNKKFLDGYTVKVWSECDLDLTPPFVRRAYAEKRWAFVSDYLRFVILRDFGGIYLDTDMELLRPLDSLCDVAGFTGWNSAGTHLYCGAVGAVPNHPLMQQLVRDYDALPAGHYPTSPDMMTTAYQAGHYDDFIVHPFQIFYPVDEGKKPDPALIAQAYATHHWDESWRKYVWLRRLLRRIGIIPLYHTLRQKSGF